MRLRAAWGLARPAVASDRARFTLIAGTSALAGGLLLAGQRIARLGLDTDGGTTFVRQDDGSMLQIFGDRSSDLAPYVSQSGLRPGVVLGTALLAVPVLALGVQALRLGSVSRERRLASLRLAGATPADVRRIAALEAGAAAAVGGVLAGPVYVGLWLLLGVLPAAGGRLLPHPDRLDVPFWAFVVVVAALAGAVAGWFLQGRVLVDPLGVRTRRPAVEPKHPAWRPDLVFGAAGLILLVVGFLLLNESGGGAQMSVMALAVLGLLIAVFAVAPRTVARRGRAVARGRGVANLLAGRRLVHEPRTGGRVCAVLALCGVALGVEGVGLWDLLLGRASQNIGDDLSFYVTGYVFAAVGVVVAVLAAAVTLVVGVADQLTDARRQLAALRALGADQQVLITTMRRQQTATAVPAVVVGVVVGGVAFGLLAGVPGPVAPGIAVAGVLSWLTVSLFLRLAVLALRPRVVAVTDPENLRVA